MKRLVKKLAFAAVGCLMVAAVAGCDLLGTAQKTGLSPQLMKHRFTFIGEPSPLQDLSAGGGLTSPEDVTGLLR
jgi:hypothetical protein